MEQHAVPQDITGFKFKLVGDMTLLQFGQLAGGLVIAWIVFSFPLHPFLKYPIAAFFALLGAGLAFVPIEERPMHVWIFNFFKAIYRPTYFIWKRNTYDSLQTPPKLSATPSPVPEYNPIPISDSPPLLNSDITLTNNNNSTKTAPGVDVVATTISTSPPQHITAPTPVSIADLMKVREQKVQQTATLEGASATPLANNSTSNQQPMTIEELVKKREEMSSVKEKKAATDLDLVEKRISDLTEQNKQLLMQIDEIKNKLYQNPNQDVADLNKDLDGLMEKKNALASQIASTRDKLNEVRVAPLTNSFYQEPVNVKRTEKVVPKIPSKQTVVSLTTIPNVVNGLVMDNSGKPIDGAILIMKDQTKNSIRALRTNRVGQFIASTPLSDGTYFIETEKADYVFDTYEINLSGKVLEPLEIRAGARETA